MLRPVKLDSARDPRAGQPDQGRLDYAVVVDKVVTVGLIQCHLHAPADLRQDHILQVAVFEEHGRVALVDPFVLDAIDDRVRVDHSAGTLVDAFFQEHGVFVRLAGPVRGNHNGLRP